MVEPTPLLTLARVLDEALQCVELAAASFAAQQCVDEVDPRADEAWAQIPSISMRCSRRWERNKKKRLLTCVINVYFRCN